MEGRYEKYEKYEPHLASNQKMMAPPLQDSAEWRRERSGSRGPGGPEATALLPSLRHPHVTFVAKESYSSFTGSTLDATLRAAGISQLYVVGINTNYCVFATTLSAWELAYDVRVLVDGVTSCDGKTGHMQGLQMLSDFFITYSSTKRVQLVNSSSIPPLQMA